MAHAGGFRRQTNGLASLGQKMRADCYRSQIEKAPYAGPSISRIEARRRRAPKLYGQPIKISDSKNAQSSCRFRDAAQRTNCGHAALGN
jgi:hypothetical protein